MVYQVKDPKKPKFLNSMKKRKKNLIRIKGHPLSKDKLYITVLSQKHIIVDSVIILRQLDV